MDTAATATWMCPCVVVMGAGAAMRDPGGIMCADTTAEMMGEMR